MCRALRAFVSSPAAGLCRAVADPERGHARVRSSALLSPGVSAQSWLPTAGRRTDVFFSPSVVREEWNTFWQTPLTSLVCSEKARRLEGAGFWAQGLGLAWGRIHPALSLQLQNLQRSWSFHFIRCEICRSGHSSALTGVQPCLSYVTVIYVDFSYSGILIHVFAASKNVLFCFVF